jgi:hypothetical protein
MSSSDRKRISLTEKGLRKHSLTEKEFNEAMNSLSGEDQALIILLIERLLKAEKRRMVSEKRMKKRNLHEQD